MGASRPSNLELFTTTFNDLNVKDRNTLCRTANGRDELKVCVALEKGFLS